jgi:cyclic-di-GMP phosphodiesterase TipF (flagellum assembly factor)
MIRISTIFIAICMALIAGSLGFVVHTMAGLSLTESGIVAAATLILLILYNAVSARLRDRTDVGGQIAGLSNGTADLARQVAEFGRRIVAIEHRLAALDAHSQERVKTTLGEISELGTLVKQLAISIAVHDELLTAPPQPVAPPSVPSPVAALHMNMTEATPASVTPTPSGGTALTAAPPNDSHLTHREQTTEQLPPVDHTNMLISVQRAIDVNRIDIHLQPLVTLPQRKVRFYEAVSRIRDENDQLIAPDNFIAAAEAGGLMAQIDRMVLLRSVQILRRLMARNKDVGLFCNISAATLGNEAVFAQCLDFLESNRTLVSSLVLEFKQSTLRNLVPLQSEHLAALAQRGFRFSVDHVSDLRIEPRDLADRGVRFIKVPAQVLLDPQQASNANIHPADLSDLLGRFGIDLVAERIEGERAVVDLLDYDIRFGQGFLFSPPRPLRPESIPAAPSGESQPPKPEKVAVEPAKVESVRLSGKAALARRAATQN